MAHTNEELVRLIQDGKDQKENLETLFTQNTGIVQKMISKYSGIAEADDLHQECFLALYEAVKCFDPGIGMNFLSYWCLWMTWKIRTYINETTTQIHIPAHVRSLITRYKELKSSAAISGVQLSPDQICECLYIPKEKLKDVIRAEQLLSVASLDAPIENEAGDGEASLHELIADKTRPIEEADEEIYAEELKTQLWAVVDSLSPSLSDVIRQRYEEGLTMEAIAEKQNCCVENIRRKQERALRKLRQPANVRRIKPFLLEECYSLGLKGNGAGAFHNSNTSSTERAAIRIMELEKALIRKKIAGTYSAGDLVTFRNEVKKVQKMANI